MKQEKETTKKSQEAYSAFCHSVPEVVEHFKTDPENGLTEKEAQNRLETYGQNKLEEAKKVPSHLRLHRSSIAKKYLDSICVDYESGIKQAKEELQEQGKGILLKDFCSEDETLSTVHQHFSLFFSAFISIYYQLLINLD